MMTYYKQFVMIGMGLAITLSVSSQVIYTCDFENAQERQTWQLNVGKNAALIDRAENKWYIEEAGNHGEKGSYGLFVSNDGTNGTYKNSKSVIMFAYRDIELQPGSYTLSFDWIGNTSAVSGEGLYACVVPVSDPSASINSGGQVVPDWVNAYKLNETVLGGASTWQICTSSFSVLATSGTSHRIVFVWFQNASQVTTPPSIAIDNICLWGAQKCAPPTDISYTITSTDLKLTWKGQADYYDVKVYDYQENKWQYSPKVGSRTLSISNLSEGVHDVFIRAHCGTEESEYVLFKPFYYQRGARCIDYLSLDDSKAATCRQGAGPDKDGNLKPLTVVRPTFTSLLNGPQYNADDFFSIHYLPDEYDPNTANELPTKPKDAVASVRIGRIQSSFSAQVEHRYKVLDGDKAILKLRYAVVLPSPHNDTPTDNPVFRLTISADNKTINCGTAEFTSGMGETGEWHSNGSGNNAILWKDWTEVSVNLRDYVGQSITVRLTILGCRLGGHGAYAYYTLDCEDGGLSGLNCGDVPTTQFIAPAGFNYAWYLPSNPDKILSTDRIFNVDPMDTLTYSVDIISKTDSKCYYTLDATAVPRFPVAEATYEESDDACENKVTFHQTCYVKYKNQITDREWISDSKIESITWDFGDGSAPLVSTNEYVTHTFPRTGGQYTVTLTAGINDNLCTVSQTMDFSFPNIQEKPVLVAADICEGDYYQYNGRYYYNTYVDTINYSSATGCDSTVIFHIVMHEKGPFPYEDTICYGDTLLFHGLKLTQTDTVTVQLKNAFGCDSIAQVNLFVDPQIVANIPDTINTCPDETDTIKIPFDLTSGRIDELELLFDEKGHLAGFQPQYTFMPDTNMLTLSVPAEIRPDVYPAKLAYATPLCPAQDKPVYVQVCYSANVILQRPRVLMLKNAEYNGGYNFKSYQWYRDGKPVENGTRANLAVSADDIEHEFYVEIVREGETTPVRTCSIWYVRKPSALDEVHVSELDGPLQVFNAIGLYWGIVNDKSELNQLPTGLYIVTNGDKVAKIIR